MNYVLAGNYKEFNDYTHGDTGYRYISGYQNLAGLRDIIVTCIGTYRDRSDFRDITDICSTYNIRLIELKEVWLGGNYVEEPTVNPLLLLL